MLKFNDFLQQLKRSFPHLDNDLDIFDDYALISLNGSFLSARVSYTADILESVEISLKLYYLAYSETWSTEEDLLSSIIDHRLCISVMQYLQNRVNIKLSVSDDTGYDVDSGYYTITASVEPKFNYIKSIIEAILDTVDYYHSNYSKMTYDLQLYETGYANYEDCLELFKQTESEFVKLYNEQISQFLAFSDFEPANLNSQFSLISSTVYMNKSKSVMIGIEQTPYKSLSMLKHLSKINTFQDIAHQYNGEDYILCRINDEVSSYQSKHLYLIKSLLQIFKDEYYYMKQSNPNKELLIMSNAPIWAIILPMRQSNEFIEHEHNKLEMKKKQFSTFSPTKNIKDIDWSSITPDTFEALCKEILVRKGFKQSREVGHTNASDNGRDIEAIEFYNTLIGVETKKWIIQCKRVSKSINVHDISNVPELLKLHKADSYGLFLTSTITPSALNMIKRWENEEKLRIKIWSKLDLEIELDQYQELITKYQLKLNSLSQ